ncbi:MAG: glycosyl hydrolase family 95 catalytic domain-containing protein, partial [Bryobacteraceae bacterium]
PTRRAFLSASMAATALAAAPQPRRSGSAQLDVDFRKLVSRADLVYTKPAPRSEAGIPVGNGRMGTLVWTTPTEMRFQINRADVYANSCASNSFNERNNDYCSGCAYADVDFGGTGNAPFPESGFAQRLSVYDGLLAIEGKDVEARVFAWPARDVVVIAVNDHRPAPAPVRVNLRMLRYQTKYFGKELATMARDHIGVVQTRSQTAASQLFARGDRIALTQEFREGGFYCKSAVAVAVVGRAGTPRFPTETEVSLTISPGPGEFQILISSAASFDPAEDVLSAALGHLDRAAAQGISSLQRDSAAWWHNFWSGAFVHLHSPDGVADFVEQNYNYYLYLMASSSRGKLPPKFNGMIFNTGGDLRTWGAQHWFANLSCYYEALPAANRLDLMDPMFDMYSGAFDAFSTAARQEWGSQGIYIPETSYFDGLEKLPDDIAAEMQDLYLLRKPWAQRSQRFMEYSQLKHPHSSRWNWIAKGEWIDGRLVETERGSGPFGNVSHILSTSAKIPYLYWRRYEFTLDRDWLRQRAYPMLKAASEFYRNFPNLKKGADGKYHIHKVNSNESV